MAARTVKRYGWKPDLPDHRDFRLQLPSKPLTLPPQSNNKQFDVPIYDQGNVGSCTGNSAAGLVRFVRKKLGLVDIDPSRLFLYWNARALEGTTDQDAGAEIRDVLHQIAVLGVAPEADCPYSDTIQAVTTVPSHKAYGDAVKDRATNYYRVQQRSDDVRFSLASGFPVNFGFTVYDSFESSAVAQSGMVPMPGPNEGVLGGHAVVALDYDDDTRMIVCRNSWSVGWGQAGYFQMPYDYIFNTDLASDFWTINMMSGP